MRATLKIYVGGGDEPDTQITRTLPDDVDVSALGNAVEEATRDHNIAGGDVYLRSELVVNGVVEKRVEIAADSRIDSMNIMRSVRLEMDDLYDWRADPDAIGINHPSHKD